MIHHFNSNPNWFHRAPFAKATLLTALVTVGFFVGCSKHNPTKPPFVAPAPYPNLSTPQNVLLALQIAYSSRDRVEYKALYDPLYVGTSEDLTDPLGTVPQAFTYSDEVAHVDSMARSTTITSVSLSLGPSSSWSRLPSDDLSHPDWALIQISGSGIAVQISDGWNTYQATGSQLFFEFAFNPTTPETSSLTDTLWKIVRWQETKGP